MYEVKVTGNSLEDLRTNFRNINSVFNNDSITMTEIDTTAKETSSNESVPETAPTVVADETLAPVAPEEVAVQEYVEVPPVIPSEVLNEGEVDSLNCPWDIRIHTEKRTKNKLGDWKLKRGVDKNYASQIIDEIRLQNAPVVLAPAVVQAPVTPAVVDTVQAPVAVETVQAPVVPTFPNSGGHSLESFSTNFAMILAGLITEKKINQKYVEDLKVYFNTTEIWDINDSQKAELFESFAGYGFITKM